MSIAYYNENDPFAAAWLRELISAGLIADGVVDDRDIQDVCPSELEGYTQCHFFAGIGGWSYALRLAGWPDTQECWTGSCPCQPFSAAGKGKGTADERHLWPDFYWLINQCRPSVVFGEQVASKAGRVWFAGVRTDLEALGYVVGGSDLCAAGVSAPHVRQRLFWLADAENAYGGWTGSQEDSRRGAAEAGGSGHGGMAYPTSRSAERSGSQCNERGLQDSHWGSYEQVETSDGRKFKIKPGLAVLVDGVSRRVDKLRGFGNAIVPQVAAAFISAYLDATNILR